MMGTCTLILINILSLKNNEPQNVKRILISISPQSLASLAVKYKLDLKTCAKKLCGFLKTYFNAEYVFDTTFSREFSLLESQKEFIEKYQKNQNDPNNFKLPILSSACPGRYFYNCVFFYLQTTYILFFTRLDLLC
jgi:iron only hydrogenase large subunit-like protein